MLGYFSPAGRNDDGIERCLLREAEGAVAVIGEGGSAAGRRA